MALKNLIPLFILALFTVNSFAQNDTDIFAEGKEYVYLVAFIQANGDTLTNEKMILLGKDEEWQYQKKQSILEVKYFPDTVNLKKYVDPRAAEEERKIKNLKKKAKGKKGWDNYTWLDYEEVTGKGITDSSIFLHPPRDNQYVYHYMNAYPEIFFNKLFIGGTWQAGIKIARGIPSNEEFVGTTISTFKVTEQLTTNFNGKNLDDCWRIEITCVHSVKGETSAEYIFSESHGFLKMDHLFYDGVQINYVLEDIVSSLPHTD
jgi:hypothetical protein